MIKIHTPLGDAYYLSKGDRGEQVKFLQSNLNCIGNQYPVSINIDIDGIFGRSTFSAVTNFQRYIKNSWNCNTMSIDGIAGKDTWTALYALMDGDNPHKYID